MTTQFHLLHNGVLGETNPSQLWETTLDPNARTQPNVDSAGSEALATVAWFGLTIVGWWLQFAQLFRVMAQLQFLFTAHSFSGGRLSKDTAV